MTTLSIFDAAREAPENIAWIDGDESVSFRAAAQRVGPLVAALLAARPRALALTPRADAASLLWLYAAFATGTPVLTLHQRATPSERRASIELLGATEPPAVAAQDVDPASLPDIADAAPLAFIPTSGSTGAPRLVELSRAAVVASARASAQNLGWEARDRWLLCLPLAHVGGLSIVLRCLLARQTTLLFEPGPSGLLGRVDDLMRVARRATLISLVPSTLAALLDAGFTAHSGLRAVLVGGAACSPALARRAQAAEADIPLLTSYGLTETASQVATRSYAQRFEPVRVRDGVVSSGNALVGVALRLDATAAGTIGVRAPSLYSGYVGEGPPALEAGGFFRTSDYGQFGLDGELYVRGRSDDVIVSGGENVDPLEVETALLALPGVDAACVFGTPSAEFGQVVTAALITRDRTMAEPSHLAELLADRLARHKLPRLAVIAESLPLTASGNVDRRAVSQRFSSAFDEASRA